MKPLCEKYRCECFADVKGQDIAIEKLKVFIKTFPMKKVAILHGPTGTGKTSLAYALAQETNSEIFELNASDLRDKEQLEKILKPAIEQVSLFKKKGKIILVDEIDGISVDKGGLPELISLIESTKFPLIITTDNIWQQKFNLLRKKSELIQLKNINYQTVFSLLEEIARKENLKTGKEILKSIAIKSRGDIRAALNDLQTVFEVNRPEEISERDKQDDIFNVLRQIFKNLPNKETLRILDTLNMPLDEVLLWLEENIPLEYKGEELYKAYQALSKADVFRGRRHRQQYWRFLVYQNIFLSVGISAAKQKAKIDFTSYRKPSRILKIWLNNQEQEKRKSISVKYAKYCHIGRKRAMKEFPIIKQVLKNLSVRKELRLTEDEIRVLEERSNV